eukprot:gene52775-72020_t
MTQPTSLRPRTLPILLGLAVAACGWPAAGMAQVAAPVASVAQATADGDTIRLSDEQRNHILAGNTVESAAA